MGIATKLPIQLEDAGTGSCNLQVRAPSGENLVSVNAEIAPEDGMFEGSRHHYFGVGQSALQCIDLAARAAGRDRFRRILDFGSGYGRVLRVLKAAFPDARFAACDVDRGAIEFCARTFGAEPIPSSENFAEIQVRDRFDLIWCGTLLTNVDAAQFSKALAFFHDLLDEDGILVFTTHGPFVVHRIRSGEFTYGVDEDFIPRLLTDYDRTGFGYADYPQEVLVRLGLNKYGISVSSPSWVLSQLELFTDLRVLNYTERAWDNHQDSVACIKSGRGPETTRADSAATDTRS